MNVTREGHPANWLHEELFSVPDQPTSEEWWSTFNKVLQEVDSLANDRRSMSSVCCSLAVVLLSRVESHQSDHDALTDIFHNQLIPLWEREIDKGDNWMHVPGHVCEFASIVGGNIGRDKLRWGLARYQESLPTYAQVQLEYPDEMLANGIEAVMVGRKNWYSHMANLYKFCDLGNDVNKILQLCRQNSWHSEEQGWRLTKDYFYNLLLNVDLPAVEPRLIENIYEYIQNERNNMHPEIFENVTRHYAAWKFARGHVYGHVDNSNTRLM